MTTEASCMERDQGRCFRCGAVILTAPHSCHHRMLRSAGGPDSLDNRIMLCGSGTTGCHGWVHAHPKQAKKDGLLLSRYGPKPHLVPVRHYWWGLVYLTEDGAVKPVGTRGVD